MNPIAWLVGLVFPACGFAGAAGLPAAVPMDIAHIGRPATPNTALAAPKSFSPPPDIVTPSYRLPASQLFALVQDIAANQRNTYRSAAFPDRLQVHYVARSPVFNFPDLIMVQIRSAGEDSSNVIIYARSVYGRTDFGANRKRVEAWLVALQTRTPPSSER